MTIRITPLGLAVAMATTLVAPAAPAAPPIGAASLPDCQGQISIGFDDEDGAFNGMSHSGVLLVVRNLGAAACRMGGLPELHFQTARGAPLPVQRRAPAGMHPGPVVLPVVIPAGAEATAPLRWTSSDAYGAHNCATPAKLVFGQGSPAHAVAWGRRLCGPAGQPIPFDEPPLRLDPVNAAGE